MPYIPGLVVCGFKEKIDPKKGSDVFQLIGDKKIMIIHSMACH
jgi:hypothetical protein